MWKWEGKGNVGVVQVGRKTPHIYNEKQKKRGQENIGVHFREHLKTMRGKKKEVVNCENDGCWRNRKGERKESADIMLF